MSRLLMLSVGLLAYLPQILAVESVTISRAIPNNGHRCVSRCVYSTLIGDVGDALDCGTPYDNNCYCATGSAAFTAAGDHFDACASSSCSAGDISQDVLSMKSIYASYCMGAGYTQPGATAWYTPAEETGSGDGNGPAPSQTDGNSAPARTTTQLTIVTETTDSGAAATQSIGNVVTLHATSTAWVHPDGSPAKAPGTSKGGDDSKWKIAVGVAVPVVAIIAAIVAWFLWRRRRGAKRGNIANPPEHPSAEYPQHQTSPPPMTETPISRKPVASPTVSSLSHPTEIHGESIRQELNPQGVDAIPTAPPAYTGGRHEVQGQTTWPENRGQSRFTEVSGHERAPELPAAYHRPHSELPGNDRFYNT